jgi:Fur family ferric uptake transcriptional regulator
MGLEANLHACHLLVVAGIKTKTELACGRPREEVGKRALAPDLKDWTKRLEEYLSAQKLRSSEQRWKIAELIVGLGEHFSAQELIARVRKRYPEMGAATVYRNLKVLCEAGLLRETLDDGDGRVIYEVGDEEHHDHIVCLDCGEIFEYHEEKIEQLQGELAERMRFRIASHKHVLYAHCTYKSGLIK